MTRRITRIAVTAAAAVTAWQALVTLSGAPPYILPGPWAVLLAYV